jgi:hypothetical protein
MTPSRVRPSTPCASPADRTLTVTCPRCGWSKQVGRASPSLGLAEAGLSLAQLHALRHLDRELPATAFDFQLSQTPVVPRA